MVEEKTREFFSSRMGLILAGIGMAVGTGNVWRFPRVAGKNGGLAFIIVWLLALFLWSIPLMMAEMLIGKKSRKGPIGAFSSYAKKGHTFLGAWVSFVTLAIMFYYSVVAGWCLRYFTYFIAGMVPSSALAAASLWKSFTNTPWQTILFHLLAILAASFIVSRGIKGGLERANRYLLPALLLMLLGLLFRALTLPGASAGLSYLFELDTASFFKAKTWLEAFSQSAWSTGAGWGLLLTFAVYSSSKENNSAADCTIIGLSNNLASLLAALVVIPTVFALSHGQGAAEAVLSKGSTGLTFTSLASLFGSLDGGWFIGGVFFLALFFASMTSLISMFELGCRTLMDWNLPRKRAVQAVAILAFILGIPSAVSLSFFNNQDWVWSLGLLVSGFFIALAVIEHGVEDSAKEIFASRAWLDKKLWSFNIRYFIPAAFVLLTTWWIYQGTTLDEAVAWYNPIARYTPGTVIVQWLVVLAVLYYLNDKMKP